MNEFIKSDLYRYYGKTDLVTFLRAMCSNSAFRYTCHNRLYTRGGYAGAWQKYLESFIEINFFQSPFKQV